MLSVSETEPVQPPVAVAVIVSGNAPACVGVPLEHARRREDHPGGQRPRRDRPRDRRRAAHLREGHGRVGDADVAARHGRRADGDRRARRGR